MELKNYIETHKNRFIEELFEWLKIPSISADSNYKDSVLKMAEKVKASLDEAGCQKTTLYETPGYPIVYGEVIKNEKLPTILIYGHYDVQPPDPLNLWDSPPFEPIIKKTELHSEGAIFSRGACDDKGQAFIHLKALEYMMKNEKLPCNVKFMIEGEEEVGSESLVWFVKRNKELLKNDVILISDTGMIANDQPSITTGLRGIASLELELTGPERDLHSGLYGGSVANPINQLAKIIASLHNDKNEITIPGFYDEVENVSEEERKEMGKAPFDLSEFKKSIGIEEEQGESTYSTLERCTIRPTLDVNGIWGGYTGEGSKTIIPSKAFAKITMRLVLGQDPIKITELVEKHLKEITPKSVKIKIVKGHHGSAYVTPVDSLGYKAAFKAYQKSFDINPIPQRGGGSIPIVSLFEEELNSKSVLMGFGLDSDAIHSPNEHFGIFNFLKGIETVPLFFDFYTKLKTS